MALVVVVVVPPVRPCGTMFALSAALLFMADVSESTSVVEEVDRAAVVACRLEVVLFAVVELKVFVAESVVELEFLSLLLKKSSWLEYASGAITITIMTSARNNLARCEECAAVVVWSVTILYRKTN